jgi:hypothetical protein
MSKLLAFFLLGSVLLVSCVHDPFTAILDDEDPVWPIDTGGIDTTIFTGIPCDEDTVYFQNDILPILVSNCAIEGCHDAETHEEGIILSTYSNVMSDDLVNPYSPFSSELYEKITETDGDDVMPPPPMPMLTPSQISMIATWIDQGALDNYCEDCDTTAVTFSGTVNPILAAYCTGCHDASTPSAGLSLTNYADVAFVAENGALLHSLNATGGYTLMPSGSSPLPDCLIDQITSWIDNGYPND